MDILRSFAAILSLSIVGGVAAHARAAGEATTLSEMQDHFMSVGFNAGRCEALHAMFYNADRADKNQMKLVTDTISLYADAQGQSPTEYLTNCGTIMKVYSGAKESFSSK